MRLARNLLFPIEQFHLPDLVKIQLQSVAARRFVGSRLHDYRLQFRRDLGNVQGRCHRLVFAAHHARSRAEVNFARFFGLISFQCCYCHKNISDPQ
jgi:hypothetical protein